MGRKKIYKEGRTQVALFLEDPELEVFDQIMWRERKTRSELAHIAILDYMKAHAEGNDTFKITEWQEDPNFQAMPTFLSDKEKWKVAYESANKDDRTRMRKKAIELEKIFVWIETNEKYQKEK